MDLTALRALLTPSGQPALQAAADLGPAESEFLRQYALLSRTYPPGLARAALEMAILRREAAGKFPFAEKLFLTREALEQASSWQVACQRAARFQGFDWVADLGCSIGSDTFALAQQAPVIGLDLDALRLAMAHANLNVLGLVNRAGLLQADLNRPLPIHFKKDSSGLFFDPARRSQGRRVFSVRAYQPSLAVIDQWLPHCPAAGVKISPGVDLQELAGYPAEVEFISLNGELKEAVLWFGPLKTAHRRATLLPGPYSLSSSLAPDSPGETRLPLSEPMDYVYEPDPTILRAGLVQSLGEILGASQLDPDIAYLTAQTNQPTPFARGWAVEGWFPFNLKHLRAYLRERDVGRVTVKKRGSPLRPEDLIRQLRLHGATERVIFLTHLRGQPIVIVGRDASPLSR